MSLSWVVVVVIGIDLRLLKPDKGIRAYLASAAGPPGAIYSSNRGLLEPPPTVPREKRDWKAEKRKRKNTGADGQQASGP